MRLPAVLILGLAVANIVLGERVVQVWFCLERCGYNRTDALDQLDTLRAYNRTVTHVSMEKWDLGDNGAIIDNGFTDLVPEVKAAGFHPIAMVTTVKLARMVTLFAQPAAFIDRLANLAIDDGFAGVDFDFEPNTAATEHQAALYARFLSDVTRTFNAKGLTVAADIAAWNTIWNMSMLGETSTNMLTTMSTYTTSYSLFEAAYEASARDIDAKQLVVGLESDNGMKPDGVAARFAFLKQAGICRVSVWQSPLPEFWWPHLVNLTKPQFSQVFARRKYRKAKNCTSQFAHKAGRHQEIH